MGQFDKLFVHKSPSIRFLSRKTNKVYQSRFCKNSELNEYGEVAFPTL